MYCIHEANWNEWSLCLSFLNTTVRDNATQNTHGCPLAWNKVHAVPSNSFSTVTRPNYGEIYIKISHNSEDHTEEPWVFLNKKWLQLHFTIYLGHIIEEWYTKNPLMPKDHTSMDHEFCNRQLSLSCMHLPFFRHSPSHEANSCTISKKPNDMSIRG